VEEEAKRLKTFYDCRIPGGKRKKAEREEEESVFVSSSSEGEPSGRPGGWNKQFSKLKKKVQKLSSSLIEIKKSVFCEFAEMKMNIKHLFKKRGFKYKKKTQSKQWTRSSEEHQTMKSPQQLRKSV